MPLDVLQRSDWYGESKPLGDVFRLHKERCGRQLEAVCRLVTHQLGWEFEARDRRHTSTVAGLSVAG
jgi:hypothetical protein